MPSFKHKTNKKIVLDEKTITTLDSKPSAHFEHTILVDDEKAEIITIPDGYEKAERFFAEVLPSQH